VYQTLQRNDSIADAVNPWDLDIYRPISARKWGKSGVSHFASIVLASDTFGHSLAFLEKSRSYRYSRRQASQTAANLHATSKDFT
jgi:hypothetical protein